MEPISIRWIPTGTHLHTLAMHVAMSVDPPGRSGESAAAVAQLLASAASGQVDIDCLVGAFAKEELVSAGVAVVSAGGAGIVLFPHDLRDAHRFGASVRVLRDVQTRCLARDVRLLESLQEPDAARPQEALREAGFRHLTQLVYLHRRADLRVPTPPAAEDITWIQYLPEREPLFIDVLERTYEKSLDCPELTGIRSPREVLRGHRATMYFDPRLWWVALHRGEGVGLLLLNRLAVRSVLEVEYAGVVREFRGQNVSDALMQRAVNIARKESVESLALAVDRRNLPATRWYDRWGFERIGVKEAWIATANPGAPLQERSFPQ